MISEKALDFFTTLTDVLIILLKLLSPLLSSLIIILFFFFVHFLLGLMGYGEDYVYVDV